MGRTKVMASALAVLATFALLFGAAAQQYPTTETKSSAQVDTGGYTTGCVIRFTNYGPRIYENSTHVCSGAQSTHVQTNGNLYIHQTIGSPIVTMSCNVDEALAVRGIICGPSGGSGITVVRFYDAHNHQKIRADSGRLTCSTCNIWMSWTHDR